jgi:hypothetical protein
VINNLPTDVLTALIYISEITWHELLINQNLVSNKTSNINSWVKFFRDCIAACTQLRFSKLKFEVIPEQINAPIYKPQRQSGVGNSVQKNVWSSGMVLLLFQLT